jgi:hypothetical protein
LSTKNPELEPIISVVQKALQNNASLFLNKMYNAEYRKYRRHKFSMMLTDEEREFIRNNPIIPFAAEHDNYPTSFFDTRKQQWQGICFELLEEIEALTGLEFVINHEVVMDWVDLLEMLETGEALIVSELIR